MRIITAEWVKKAEADWQAAKRLAGLRVHDVLCFHCQQAVEKYLKAVLAENALYIPKIHELDELLDLLPSSAASLKKYRRRLRTLTAYAAEYRYPGKKATARKARSAAQWTAAIRDAVRVILGLRRRK